MPDKVKLILHFGTKEFELKEGQENPLHMPHNSSGMYRVKLAHGGELVYRLSPGTDYAVEERVIAPYNGVY